MRDPSSPVPFLFSKSGWLAVVLFVVALALAPTGALAQNSADLNRSGMVDSEDLLLLNEQWHTSGFVPVPDNPAAQANSQITGVTIPADNKPEVTFTFVDGDGNPIALNRVRRVSFLFARIEEDNLAQNRTHYVNYILNNSGQPTFDGGGLGNLTDLGGGVYKFKFNTAIPVTNPALTHTVGAQLEHDFDGDGTTDSFANPLFNFRPDGNPVTTVRELSSTEACNQCHNVLALHGGGRREYGLCILCHNPGVVDPDTGASVDMANLAHQIHLGSGFQGANNVSGATDGINGASPYVVVGFGGRVHNYERVVFPQDIRNCETCHTGAELKVQGDYYRTVPSQRACGGCHDKTNANTGVNHAVGAFPDTACNLCHAANQGSEFDITIPGAHVVPRKSASLPKLIAEIVNVNNAVPGVTPTVTFKLSSVINNVTSTVAPGDLSRVAVTMAAPTAGDYSFDRVETISNANSIDNGDGSRSYTFTNPIPVDVTGTIAFAMEASGNSVTLGGESVRAAADNPVVYVELAKAVQPRRQVIDWNKCLNCHEVLSRHGANRNQYAYCVMCHRPGATDIARRPAEKLPEESIHFKVMIHKIHSGEELEKPYTVYGNRPHDYTEVLFPGNRRDCESCHLPGTYGLPLPEGVANTAIIGGVTDIQPISATCFGCHDSDVAAEHINSMVDLYDGAEGCIECHGPAERWSVEVVHFEQD